MKVYVSVDMEGVSGVVHYEQTDPAGYDYGSARRWMEDEGKAAVEGAVLAGAAEVVVCDAHGGNAYRNLRPGGWPRETVLVSGSPHRPLGQVEGLDESFAALLLVGYHVRHGAVGVLSHTTNGRTIANVWLNDRLVGECGLNIAMAGHFGVPTVLITGDDRTIAEVSELVPSIERVVVKQAISQYAARSIHSSLAQQRIRAAATRALQRRGEITPFRLSLPVTVRVQFKDTASAGAAAGLPGVGRTADDTIAATAQDVLGAYRAYRTMVNLAVPGFGEWINKAR